VAASQIIIYKDTILTLKKNKKKQNIEDGYPTFAATQFPSVWHFALFLLEINIHYFIFQLRSCFGGGAAT
jgi:hypothetical protein